MTNWKHLTRLPVYILVAGMVSACGATSSSFNNSGAAQNSSSVTPTPTSTPTTDEGPALSYGGIEVTGPGGASPTYSAACGGTNVKCANPNYISTTNLLEVQVTPAGGGNLVAPSGAYSGFSANYNCASYQVQVLDSEGQILGSQQTNMLAVAADAPCMDAGGEPITTTSQILNFSSEISESNHGGLDVQISAVDYDFYCKLLYTYLGDYATESEYYDLWCPSKVVYYTHTVGASMQIEINGTTF